MVGEGVKILAKSPRFETRVTAKVPGPGIGVIRGNLGQDLRRGRRSSPWIALWDLRMITLP